MSQPRSIEEVRGVKDRLAAHYGTESWYRGVGIVPQRRGGLALPLNVTSDARDLSISLPAAFEGIPVQLVFMDTYKPRG